MYYPYTCGLSSIAFGVIPYMFRVPPIIRRNALIMAACSAQYHILEEYRHLNRRLTNGAVSVMDNDDDDNDDDACNDTSNTDTMVDRVSGCIDGVGIVLMVTSLMTTPRTSIALAMFYASTNLTSNLEMVKTAAFGTSVISTGMRSPITLVPMMVSMCGLYHQRVNGGRWNHWNRAIWHLGNIMYIVVGCAAVDA